MHRIISVVLVVMLSTPAFAQGRSDRQMVSTSPRRHISTIVLAGISGAVLGLSTLSFYGRPQDRLSNIAVGFAVGVIGGTVYTTYKAAAEPRDFYSLREVRPEAWEQVERREESAPQASFTWDF